VARSALSFLVFGWLTLLPAARASAEEAPRSVLLAIEDCPGGTLKLADAYQAARLELEQAGIASAPREAGASDAQGELTASLRCDRGVEATLRLRVSGDPSSASRVISLNDANPKDRPRLLGLALAELVRSDWSDLVERSRAPAAGAAKPADAAPSRAPAEAAPSVAASNRSSAGAAGDSGAREPSAAGAGGEPSRLALTADALARWFTAAPAITLGAAFGLERGWFSVGIEGVAGHRTVTRGATNYGLGAATLGAAVLRAVSRRGRLTLGPKVALGGTWATGESSDTGVVASGTGGLYADARIEATGAVRVGSIELGARLSGGRAAGLSLKDDGDVIGATGGWFLGGALGVRW